VSEWVVLSHVASAFWFVAGLVGRDVTLAKARGAADVREVASLAELAGRFDRWMVVPGSMAVLLLGLAAAWASDLSLVASGNRWLLASLVLYLTSIPFVPLVFVPKGKVFEAALADAESRGELTPALRSALADPLTRVARTYEWVMVAIVVVLMVVKPF
jgi:hypothetical protein